MALIGLQEVSIHFGGPLVLDGAGFYIQRGERVCLLGRNGAGKTTLMRLVSGEIQPDKGSIIRQQGITTALLTQEVPDDMRGLVFDVVLGGLGQRGERPAEYHRLGHQLMEGNNEILLKKLDDLQKRMEADGGWDVHREAETVITRMNLDPDVLFEDLSAGMKRRVLLARALVSHPDILMLDEPTNHMDIDSINWLEEFLLKWKQTLLFVTHDRMVVRKLATRIIEIDRGRLSSWDCNYEEYLDRKAADLASEQGRWDVFDKKLAKEEVWLRQGVKARRTRDMGRVEALMQMREERRARREKQGTVNMQLQDTRLSGKLVIEAAYLSFSFQNQSLVRDFSTVIMRGDRVGIIGPNGCGKTTLLRLLLGELMPVQGELRQGTNLEIAYFDQLRNTLDDSRSVMDNVADGSDRIVLNGKNRHVIGYLEQFLFSPDRVRGPVKVLSGGERNRLLLAKLFARPSNLLVMDEPTNDLDVETLELLEEMLLQYQGTLLLVSHDREFLNNVVTSTLVFEGDGKIGEYIGGYDDWVSQRLGAIEPAPVPDKTTREKKETAKPAQRKKLSNKEREELEKIPLRIEQLETEQKEIYQQIGQPQFYQQTSAEIARINQRLEVIKKELEIAFNRWQELEELQTAMMQ